MIQFTTPTLRLTVRGADLTGTEVYATIRQGGGRDPIEGEITSVTYDGEAEATVVLADFSQTQTGRLRKGEATVQVNFVTAEGRRLATAEKRIEVGDNHIKEVLAYGS